jgi:hypothetical protein
MAIIKSLKLRRKAFESLIEHVLSLLVKFNPLSCMQQAKREILSKLKN